MTADAALRIAGLHTDTYGVGAEQETLFAGLVVAGRKQGHATAGLQGQPTRMGRRKAVLTGDGRPVAIVETVNYEKLTFETVTEEHARLQGEGDLSLAFWRDRQEQVFRTHMIFQPDMSIWFDTFRLLEVLDDDFAAGAHAHVAAEIRDARDRGFSLLHDVSTPGT